MEDTEDFTHVQQFKDAVFFITCNVGIYPAPAGGAIIDIEYSVLHC